MLNGTKYTLSASSVRPMTIQSTRPADKCSAASWIGRCVMSSDGQGPRDPYAKKKEVNYELMLPLLYAPVSLIVLVSPRAGCT